MPPSRALLLMLFPLPHSPTQSRLAPLIRGREGPRLRGAVVRGFAWVSLLSTLSLAVVPASANDRDRGATTASIADPEGALDLRSLTSKEVAGLVERDVESLGSLSLGFPNNGQLLGGVQLQESDLFELVAPDFAWGTAETIDYLKRAVAAVHAEHEDTPPLHVGHISDPDGGYLSPHLSHQSGRDVDLGFYYQAKRTWYRRATATTLDAERTWTLVRALITETDVELILIDHWVQSLLRTEAERQGEDPQWLDAVFRGSPDRPAIIRHAPGHATHIHVRFFSPRAQENGRLAYPHLLERELIEPVVVYIHHRVRKGETLGRIAKRYGTTVQAIQQANGLRSTLIQARKSYRIPRAGGPAPIEDPIEIPARILPPTPES